REPRGGRPGRDTPQEEDGSPEHHEGGRENWPGPSARARGVPGNSPRPAASARRPCANHWTFIVSFTRPPRQDVCDASIDRRHSGRAPRPVSEAKRPIQDPGWGTLPQATATAQEAPRGKGAAGVAGSVRGAVALALLTGRVASASGHNFQKQEDQDARHDRRG